MWMPEIEPVSSGKAASTLTTDTSLQPSLPTCLFVIFHFSQENLPKLYIFEFSQLCIYP